MPHASDVMLQADNYTPEVPIRESLQSKLDALTAVIPFTGSRTSLGVYTITFTTPLSDSSYTIMLTTEHSQGTLSAELDDDYMVSYNSKSASGFGVKVTEQDNSAAAGNPRDCQFDFVCFKAGRVLCHGSVAGDGVVVS